MLKLGSSIRWQQVIEILTGGKENDFNLDALLEYFHPLEQFLNRYLKENNVPIGWNNHNLSVKF